MREDCCAARLAERRGQLRKPKFDPNATTKTTGDTAGTAQPLNEKKTKKTATKQTNNNFNLFQVDTFTL